MSGRQKRDAFAVIHFGANPIYLELELYFFKMLRQYTRNDIVYLYSVNDTPAGFVDAVRPLVTEVVPYDDRGITYEVSFKSGYGNFNTLRTCNFIFAYTLEKYNKVCIIESDMVIMKNIDAVFGLKAPAALTYLVGDRNVKYNDRVKNVEREVLEKCHDMGRINGGVMLIHPSAALFEEYKSKIVDVVQRECKYPNETLFEYVNREYYNLPIQYNLSHYLAKGQKLAEYRLSPSDIVVFHFNETKYKHIDIIKNPLDENGDNWLDIIKRDKKYDVKKLPILHYKTTVFDKYRTTVEPMMIEAIKKVATPTPDVVTNDSFNKDASLTPIKLDEIRKASPIASLTKDEIQPFATTNATPIASLTKDKTAKKPKKTKCPKGTRKNRRTGVCEPKSASPKTFSPKALSPTPSLSSSLAAEPLVAQQLAAKLLEGNLPTVKLTDTKLPEEAPLSDTKKPKKCPKGTRKNRRTGICEPVK